MSEHPMCYAAAVPLWLPLLAVGAWRKQADEMVRQYDEAFPTTPMCAFYVRSCSKEIPGVPEPDLYSYMRASLRRLRAES